MRASLHLPELRRCLQVCGARRGLPIAKSVHPRGKVVESLLVWLRLAGRVVRQTLVCRLTGLTGEGVLASGVFHLLERDAVWGCPRVVGEVVHVFGSRGIDSSWDALQRVYR